MPFEPVSVIPGLTRDPAVLGTALETLVGPRIKSGVTTSHDQYGLQTGAKRCASKSRWPLPRTDAADSSCSPVSHYYWQAPIVSSAGR